MYLVQITNVEYTVPKMITKRLEFPIIFTALEMKFRETVFLISDAFKANDHKHNSLTDGCTPKFINNTRKKFKEALIRDRDLLINKPKEEMIKVLNLYLEISIYEQYIEYIKRNYYDFNVASIMENLCAFIASDTQTTIKEKVNLILILDEIHCRNNRKMRNDESNKVIHKRIYYNDLVRNGEIDYRYFDMIRNDIVKNYVEICLATKLTKRVPLYVDYEKFINFFAKYNYPFIYFNKVTKYKDNLRGEYDDNNYVFKEKLIKYYNSMKKECKYEMHKLQNEFKFPKETELSNDHIVPVSIIKYVVERIDTKFHRNLDTFHINIENMELMEESTNNNSFATLKDNKNKDAYIVFLNHLKKNLIS